jgi:predicted flap endonuclease-1-like 5' DNA nuclease
MTKKRPFGVTILAILAGIGAVIAIYHTLQMLHLLPISGPFGVFKFFTFDLLGAIVWGILALIYIWVVRKLWNLDPQGWLFVAALATINLILAVISVIGQSTWQAMLPAILVNGLILFYVLLPNTKEAFGVSDFATEEPMQAVTTAPVPEADDIAEPTPEADLPAEPATESFAIPEAMVAEEQVEVAEVETSEPVSEEMVEEDEGSSGVMVTGVAAASHDLSYVEGIGEVYGGKLKAAGVSTPQELLERGATPKGRKELAEATEISEHLILKWVNHVDLYRISGIGSEYADLLEASGVDTVVELAQRNAANLYQKLNEVNAEKSLVRKLPTNTQVEDWVAQAKNLPRVITY